MKQVVGSSLVAITLVLAGIVIPDTASATINVDVGSVHPGKIGVGETVTITFAVSNEKISKPFELPHVDGLTVYGTGNNPHINSFYFFVAATHAGDLIIPAFDIPTDDGKTHHVNPIKLHVVGK